MEQQATEPTEVADVSDRLADYFDKPDEDEVPQDEELTDEAEEESPEESDEEETEGEEVPESVEVDGKVIELPEGTPPEVVEAVTAAIAEKERSLKADYTAKTQEAAEMRRAATAYYEQTQQQAAFNQQHIMDIAKLQGIVTQVQEYDAINWNELADADPVAFLKYQHQRTELRETHARLYQELNEQANSMNQQRSEQQRIAEQQGRQVLAKDIPGWGAEYAAKINGFGQKTYGFTAAELGNIFDPRMVKVLNDAFKYQELKTKGVKAKQVPEAPRKFVKPGAKVTQSTESERRAREHLRQTGRGAASLLEKFL